MNWRSQQNKYEPDSQLLKLAHKNPFFAETAISAVGSPEKGSAVGASVSSTLRSARLGAQSGDHLPNPFMQPLVAQIERENKAAAGTIKIILRPVNRCGRSRASLPDGTVLVASSRHPYLDAARVLIAAGHDPDSWLEGWLLGAIAFVVRARLGTAALLTVDEARTPFAPWKAFSASAVASSIDYSEETATTSALLQPPLEQLSSLADERTDQIEFNFQNGSNSSSRA